VALFAREPRGDQRTGPLGCLHHDDTERDAGDQAVAAREILAAWRKTWRAFGDEQATLADRRLQLFILRRIDDVDAAGEHGDGAVFERGAMRRGVDAARQTGGDDEAFQCEIGGKLPREFLPDRGAVG
jgi:hypothetical protein